MATSPVLVTEEVIAMAINIFWSKIVLVGKAVNKDKWYFIEYKWIKNEKA